MWLGNLFLVCHIIQTIKSESIIILFCLCANFITYLLIILFFLMSKSIVEECFAWILFPCFYALFMGGFRLEHILYMMQRVIHIWWIFHFNRIFFLLFFKEKIVFNPSGAIACLEFNSTYFNFELIVQRWLHRQISFIVLHPLAIPKD